MLPALFMQLFFLQKPPKSVSSSQLLKTTLPLQPLNYLYSIFSGYSLECLWKIPLETLSSWIVSTCIQVCSNVTNLILSRLVECWVIQIILELQWITTIYVVNAKCKVFTKEGIILIPKYTTYFWIECLLLYLLFNLFTLDILLYIQVVNLFLLPSDLAQISSCLICQESFDEISI